MKTKKYLATSFLLAISFLLNGCSLIGLGIGAIADWNEPDFTPIKIEQLANLKRGETVTISLFNNESVAGKFLNFKPSLRKTYYFRYNHYLDTSRYGGKLPRNYERIVINKVNGEKTEYNFLGLNKKGLFGRDGNGEINFTRFNQIKFLSSGNSYIYYLKPIKKIIQQPDFPLISDRDELKLPILSLYSNNEKVSFPQNEISRISITNNKNGMLTGFLVGLSIDAIIIYHILSNPPGVNLGGLGSW